MTEVLSSQRPVYPSKTQVYTNLAPTQSLIAEDVVLLVSAFLSNIKYPGDVSLPQTHSNASERVIGIGEPARARGLYPRSFRCYYYHLVGSDSVGFVRDQRAEQFITGPTPYPYSISIYAQ
jgi:hypothetical protein